jgi:hypothetical protein
MVDSFHARNEPDETKNNGCIHDLWRRAGNGNSFFLKEKACNPTQVLGLAKEEIRLRT